MAEYVVSSDNVVNEGYCSFCLSTDGAYTLESMGLSGLRVYRGDEVVADFATKYCPMCGKKLVEDEYENAIYC